MRIFHANVFWTICTEIFIMSKFCVLPRQKKNPDNLVKRNTLYWKMKMKKYRSHQFNCLSNVNARI